MQQIEIRVIKTAVFQEMGKYLDSEIKKCPIHTEGQVFTTTYEKPHGFCDWAWNDLRPFVLALMTGGNFSEGIFKNWMKDRETMVACCTDGIRPVIFEIKRTKNEL